VLSVLARIAPSAWGVAVASGFRSTLLAPFLFLQHQAELTKTSRAKYAEVENERDSLALAADSLAMLRLENRELRNLLGLRARLPGGYVAAAVLHQSSPGEALLTLSVGRAQGVRPFAPVIATDGLVGVIRDVDARTSVMMVWAHSDFRASAMTEDGGVFGIVAPAGAAGPNQMLMELTGVPYREQVEPGTAVYTSGLGGVYPRGIPLGRVIAVGAEGEGWSRTYIVQPAVHPASISHVIILTGEGQDLRPAFRTESP
jgi:rod shape-determining protein MreC